MAKATHPNIAKESVFCYRIPAEEPESDGTLKWNATDLVIVKLKAGKAQGLGYTYAAPAVAKLIKDVLFEEVHGADPMAISFLWYKMLRKLRNLGNTGSSAMAVAAVDNALWD